MDKKKVQITLVSTTGQYKPVSTIIHVDSAQDFRARKKEYIAQAITKICQKRLWTQRDLKAYGYTVIKAREYDEEKIKEQNEQRYEEIKREKFATGEWTPTKKQLEEMEKKA